MFVTLCLGVLDVQTGEFSYVNGGHNPPFLSRQNAPFDTLPMPKGLLLGVKDDAAFEVARVSLQPGDSLLLYTDGVTDAEDGQRSFFSAPRAREVLSAAASEPVAGLVEALHRSIVAFAGGTLQTDDITMLALRYTG
jgi:sigma-B regulation protein RsbU (phosphoserine phosphatase)